MSVSLTAAFICELLTHHLVTSPSHLMLSAARKSRALEVPVNKHILAECRIDTEVDA